MQKKVPISLDNAVYEGLIRLVGHGKTGKFIENLVRPHVFGGQLDEGYRATAATKRCLNGCASRRRVKTSAFRERLVTLGFADCRLCCHAWLRYAVVGRHAAWSVY